MAVQKVLEQDPVLVTRTGKRRNEKEKDIKLLFKSLLESFYEVASIFNKASLQMHKGMRERVDEPPCVILP